MTGILGRQLLTESSYQHVAWLYAFQFLRLSLSLESSLRPDILSSLGQIRNIMSIAERYGDRAITLLASVLEALCYLRLESTAENLEQAQRAIAVARSLQFDSVVAQLPQLAAMTSFVDICCLLRCSDTARVASKLQEMRTALETVHTNSSWNEIGTLLIPINHSQASRDQSCKGVIQDASDGHQMLAFNWMPKNYIYTLGYLMSGISTIHKNALDGQRSEQMLNDGLRKCDGQYDYPISLHKLMKFSSTSYACRRPTSVIVCSNPLPLMVAVLEMLYGAASGPSAVWSNGMAGSIE